MSLETPFKILLNERNFFIDPQDATRVYEQTSGTEIEMTGPIRTKVLNQYHTALEGKSNGIN